MKFFHGTTADNLASILANGLLTEKGGENWNVSGENVYFWSPDELVRLEMADDMESALRDARQRAFESGQIGLGFAKDCRVIILEVELPEGDISPDDSCDNMDGAVYSGYDVPLSAVKSIRVSEDLSLIKGTFLSFVNGRDMASRELSKVEQKVAKLFAKAEIYPEDIEDMAGAWEDWQEIPLPK